MTYLASDSQAGGRAGNVAYCDLTIIVRGNQRLLTKSGYTPVHYLLAAVYAQYLPNAVLNRAHQKQGVCARA